MSLLDQLTKWSRREQSELDRARRTLLISQSTFFVTILTCLVLCHNAAAEGNGISYYGVYRPTIALLVVGYLAGAAGLWRAALLLHAAGAPVYLRIGLDVVSVGLIVLLATPYTVGTLFNWAHMSTGVTMALVQLTLSTMLLVKQRDVSIAVSFLVQLGGGIVAALSLPDWTFNYLLQGETVYEAGFAMCLWQWTRYVKSLDARASVAH